MKANAGVGSVWAWGLCDIEHESGLRGVNRSGGEKRARKVVVKMTSRAYNERQESEVIC